MRVPLFFIYCGGGLRLFSHIINIKEVDMHALGHVGCDSRRRFLYIAVLLFIAVLSFALCGCGGGSGGGGNGGSYVNVNTLDGGTDIATDSSFQYTFSGAPNASTVTATSYFIVPTPATAAAQVAKAAYDPRRRTELDEVLAEEGLRRHWK